MKLNQMLIMVLSSIDGNNAFVGDLKSIIQSTSCPSQSVQMKVRSTLIFYWRVARVGLWLAGALVVCVPASAQPNLTNGWYAYYSFNSGTTTDDSGNGLNGTVSGAVTPTNGWVGSAFHFGGSGGITFPNFPRLDQVTVAAAVKPAQEILDATSGIFVIVDRWTGEENILLRLRHHEGAVRFSASFHTRFDDHWFYPEVDSYSQTIPSAAQFYHVAATHENGQLKLYVNGVLEATTATTNGSPYSASATGQPAFRIGNLSGTQQFFRGIIDEVYLYNRALSASEIVALANPIQILSHPITVFTTNGGLATFNVSAIGHSTLNYQWRFNHTNLLTGQTNATLIISNAQPVNVGGYSVVVSNQYGVAVSSNAFLTIVSPGLDDDGDGLLNADEIRFGTNPTNPDTDGDDLLDYAELFVFGTSPLAKDSDGDGIPDGWEIQFGLNPLVNDADEDADFDGLTNRQEYQYSLTNPAAPLHPRRLFSQAGENDYAAFTGGDITNRMFYDRNDRLLGVESSRGISFAYRYDGNDNLVQQAVLSRNAETNGLPILWRYLNDLTNQTSPYFDNDGDGWTDYQEWKSGSDPQAAASIPILFGNPGTNIASLSLAFTPSNFVVGVGQLDGVGAEEIVIGADGDAGTNNNFLLVLTEAAIGWSTQRVDVGAFGITSIAVGQVPNRPSPGIYVGLRETNGLSRLVEFAKNGVVWQSNLLAFSTNGIADAIGMHSGIGLLASLSASGVDAGLLGLSFSNAAWTQTVLSTNRGDSSRGALGRVWSRVLRDVSVRLVQTNQIEVIAGDREAVKNGLFLPTNWVFNPTTSKFYFQSTNAMSRDDGESFAQQYGEHLATISDPDENAWLAGIFTKPYWIGLYMQHNCCSLGLIYGSWISSGQTPTTPYTQWNSYWENNPFYYFEGTAPPWPKVNGVCVGLNNNDKWNCKLPNIQYRALVDATGVQTFTNRWLLPAWPSSNLISWKAGQIASGRTREHDTNATTLLRCFVSDTNFSGIVDAGDHFVVAEYRVSGDSVTLTASTNFPVYSETVAQSYGLITVDFTGAGTDYVFVAEPDGTLSSWTASNPALPLQRQLFTRDYLGMGWHALAGVRMVSSEQALVGLMVNATNPSSCDVMLWPPQAVLSSPQTGVIQTPPSAVVLPAVGTLGGQAAVMVRLWDAEGNAATPFLQYQISGTTSWQPATIMRLNGQSYSTATRVAAAPTGQNHSLVWNALADLGANTVTNVLLRARARDFLFLGSWSAGTPFSISTAVGPDADGNGLPDWWETQYFGSNAADSNGDPDGDGFKTWQEYVADTNPTNSASHLRITGATMLSGGIKLDWQGGTQATQFLQRATILSPLSWQTIFTNLPPTPTTVSYTDSWDANVIKFYRIEVAR